MLLKILRAETDRHLLNLNKESEFLTKIKMIVCQNLADKNSNASDVAQQTGFKNSSGFTRFFIRYNQQRPLQYRMENKHSIK